ncbi:MAG: hypothetical protein NTY19_26725 [Planctomycetota bacterium]|nr:hypothetical protein [Planctomycetota bacterium]
MGTMNAFAARVKTQVVAVFAAGGAAIGRFFNELGIATQRLAETVLQSFPRLQVLYNQPIGSRFIDYVLRSGDRVALLEVKYRIPISSGPAFDRLVGQIQAMASSGQGQVVVWSCQAPGVTTLNRIQDAVGPTVYSQIQFIDGLWGLQQWISMFFGM